VAGRLLAAQDSLPNGLRILFVEGYPPLALQRAYFEEYLGELRLANPAASEQELFNAASRYLSPPDIAPHSAGAPAACYGPVNRPGGGALAGHVVGGGQHLPTDGLQLDLREREPGRYSLGHAPFPDRGGVQAAARG